MTRPPVPPARADWTDLAIELDHWTAAGRQASFWWRDDDAVAWTPALERLLARAEGLPVALAVIPGEAEPALGEALAEFDGVRALQHGWRHENHAPDGEKKTELGRHRSAETRLRELAAGHRRMTTLFGEQALPVLVPPWNRMDADLLPTLPELGIHGLSADQPRDQAEPVAGLRVVNIHVDLGLLAGHPDDGERLVLGAAVRHLRERRAGRVDAAEPTGLLTHHRVQDGIYDDFLDRFLAVAAEHPAVRFPSISDLFAPS